MEWVYWGCRGCFINYPNGVGVAAILFDPSTPRNLYSRTTFISDPHPPDTFDPRTMLKYRWRFVPPPNWPPPWGHVIPTSTHGPKQFYHSPPPPDDIFWNSPKRAAWFCQTTCSLDTISDLIIICRPMCACIDMHVFQENIWCTVCVQ